MQPGLTLAKFCTTPSSSFLFKQAGGFRINSLGHVVPKPRLRMVLPTTPGGKPTFEFAQAKFPTTGTASRPTVVGPNYYPPPASAKPIPKPAPAPAPKPAPTAAGKPIVAGSGSPPKPTPAPAPAPGKPPMSFGKLLGLTGAGVAGGAGAIAGGGALLDSMKGKPQPATTSPAAEPAEPTLPAAPPETSGISDALRSYGSDPGWKMNESSSGDIKKFLEGMPSVGNVLGPVLGAKLDATKQTLGAIPNAAAKALDPKSYPGGRIPTGEKPADLPAAGTGPHPADLPGPDAGPAKPSFLENAWNGTKDWVTNNPGTAMAGGGLGLAGLLYAMSQNKKKKRHEPEEDDED